MSNPEEDDDLNDAGNADRLVKKADGNLIYVPEHQDFYVYGDGLWRRDPHRLAVNKLAEQAIREELRMTRHMPPALDNDYRGRETRLRFLGKKSLNNSSIRAMADLARGRVAVPLEKLDADDHLLGLENGVLDLRTLTLKPNAREDHITRRAAVSFDPEATCPGYDAFMSETFGGQQPLIDYVNGILGYVLSGNTHRQEFYIFTGDGANGKSTLVAVLQALEGSYARSILPATLFEGYLGEQGNYDLGMLPGVRLVIAAEAESKARLHGARIKQLSGGDTIAARPIRQAPIEFKPKAKLLLVTNKRPEVDAYDDALKRRVRLINFPNRVPEDRQDPHLVSKLLKERSGILNRILRAAIDLEEHRISVPNSVLAATTEYFADKDHVAAFLTDAVDRKAGAAVQKTLLHRAYAAWCRTECVQALSPPEFARVMKLKGFEEMRNSRMRGWKDIILRHSAEDAMKAQEEADNIALFEDLMRNQ